ncbi:hypothetical protein [Sphingomonas japonica]|uniref:Phasin protein n=1 Tax=Sphingomonas japonica TaxID=511662 RepID=A0ABX0U4P8_9SPHN|nr:hypothetical protein [Sphingomonas japonica]NIJ24267.1 hypothetical protein [Sphingomonas japonica]
MSDWFSAAVKLQGQMLDAQRQQMAATKKMLDAGEQMAKFQEAGTRAAEANMAAWQSWAKLWGMR